MLVLATWKPALSLKTNPWIEWYQKFIIAVSATLGNICEKLTFSKIQVCRLCFYWVWVFWTSIYRWCFYRHKTSIEKCCTILSAENKIQSPSMTGWIRCRTGSNVLRAIIQIENTIAQLYDDPLFCKNRIFKSELTDYVY